MLMLLRRKRWPHAFSCSSLAALMSSSTSRHVRSNRSQQSSSLHTDVTGNKVSSKHPSTVSKLDEAIMDSITMQDEINDSLVDILQLDDGCAIAHILLIIEKSKSMQRDGDVEVISKSFEALEKMIALGSITPRETLLGASSLEIFRGDFGAAAKLLESSLLDQPEDALAIKLVQNCYIALGDKENVLKCLTRGLHAFQDKHHLHGHMLGMLTAGFVENGMIAEAEEAGNRSVQRTRGRDCWALHSVLNAYQMTGRASEALTLLELHQSKNVCMGAQLLLFNQGCLMVQRGNCIGASKVADLLIASLENADVKIISSFTNAALLLWLIGLNKFDANLACMWVSLTKVLIASKPNGSLTAMDDIANIMTLARAASLTDIDIDNDVEVQTPEPPTAQNSHVFSGLQNWFGKKKEKTLPELNNESVDQKKQIDLNSNRDLLVKCATLIDEFNRSKCESPVQLNFNDLCPSLLKVKSRYSLSFKHSHTIGNVNLLTWNTSTSFIGKGLEKFARKEFSESSVSLNLSRGLFKNLGGLSVQRDIIDQTMVESFMRCSDFENAKLLLCEKTSLNPNDAQSWRRLASVYGHLGDREKADAAHYTAWQLGIGQGGFGGSR